jgi:tRNA(Ile)-lysidine synthase
MRLNRGGRAGLAGMRARAAVPGHPDVPLLRPLLGWRRAGLPRWSLPPGSRPPMIPRTATPASNGCACALPWPRAGAGRRRADRQHGASADADAAIEWMAERAFATARRDTDGLVWAMAVPRAVALRVLERIVAELGAGQPRGPELARWHDALEAGDRHAGRRAR